MQVLSVKVPFSEAAVSNHDARHLNLWVQNSVTIYDCTSFTLKFQDFHASEQLKEHQDGRVVKALDLRSNGHMSSWVRTPLLVYLLMGEGQLLKN